ncbi:MAG: hypothetical protein DRN09_01050, partial [Thermoplasmata archaeon]
LDYYTRTTFELLTEGLGAQNAVAGGGRYDGLVKLLGGPEQPAIGFAIGMERTVELLKKKKEVSEKTPDLFICTVGSRAKEISFSWMLYLREKGLWVEMNYGERKNITAYICGDGDITVSITNTNTTILNVWSGEELIENIQHFVIHSTNSSEHPITVQLQANKPNVTAYLIYTIQIGNESHIYTTTIKIGPEQKVEKKQDNSMLYIIVGMALAGVIGYVAYNQIKYRR